MDNLKLAEQKLELLKQSLELYKKANDAAQVFKLEHEIKDLERIKNSLTPKPKKSA